jgi:hypothetical protein
MGEKVLSPLYGNCQDRKGSVSAFFLKKVEQKFKLSLLTKKDLAAVAYTL